MLLELDEAVVSVPLHPQRAGQPDITHTFAEVLVLPVSPHIVAVRKNQHDISTRSSMSAGFGTIRLFLTSG